MNIDVNIIGIDIKEKRANRITSVFQHSLIGPPDCAEKQFVTHRPVVHKQILGKRVGFVKSRQADIAADADIVARGINQQCVFAKLPPHHIAETFEAGIEQFALTGVETDLFLLVIHQIKRHLRVGHGNPVNHVNTLGGFAAAGFQKLEPCRRGIEQVSDFDSGTDSGRRRNSFPSVPAVDFKFPPVFRLPGSRHYTQSRHRRNGRQGLAAKPKIADMKQIIVRKF